MTARKEDEIRDEMRDALSWLDGLDVRRVFSGWGFYRKGLLFAAAWDGKFRLRARREGHWAYDSVANGTLNDPDKLRDAILETLAALEREPASRPAARSVRPQGRWQPPKRL